MTFKMQCSFIILLRNAKKSYIITYTKFHVVQHVLLVTIQTASKLDLFDVQYSFYFCYFIIFVCLQVVVFTVLVLNDVVSFVCVVTTI